MCVAWPHCACCVGHVCLLVHLVCSCADTYSGLLRLFPYTLLDIYPARCLVSVFIDVVNTAC